MIILLLIIIGIQLVAFIYMIYKYYDMKKQRNEAWSWYVREVDKKQKI